jgi:regulator of sirC expression with transglutaminase-like and TPR domain
VEGILDLLAGRSDLDLDRAALELAQVEYPGLDPGPFLQLLDSYAVELAGRLDSEVSGRDYVRTANRYLFDELGFKGNSRNYYDPRNSCLNDVLSVRAGIPITLSLVYMEIARRLAKPVYGIGLPGHFLVEYRDAGFSSYIDAFHGGRLLSPADCFALAREATGSAIPEDERLLHAATKRQIIVRMTNNLRNVYLLRRAYGKTLRILDLLLAADPGAAEEYKQRGIVHIQMRNPTAARADLETYLHLMPEAADRPQIETQLRQLRTYLAGLN